MSTGSDASVNEPLLRQAKINASLVIELGSAAGNFARAYRRRNPGAEYIGIELIETEAEKSRDALDHLIIGTIEDPGTLEELDRVLDGRRADLLIIGDVLGHLIDPWTTLTRLGERMAETGAIATSIANASHWSLLRKQLLGEQTYKSSGLRDKTQLRFFTRKDAGELLREAGFHPSIASPFIVAHENRDGFVRALLPAAQHLGLSERDLRQEVLPSQWIYTASRARRRAPIRVTAIGIGGALDSLSIIRLRQPLEALRSLGESGHKLVTGTFELPDPDSPPGILVTYRLHPQTPAMWKQIEALIARGWLFVHDVDDHPAYLNGQKRQDFKSIRHAHLVTVSTPELAQVCRQWNDNVEVVPNQILTLASPAAAFHQNDRPRVFWGAIGREQEWEPGVREAVTGWLSAAGERIKTQIVNNPELASDIGPAAHTLPLLSYSGYLSTLAGSDIALVPLIDNAFNRCKSDLKIIECLASGVVPVCSPFAAQQTSVPERHLRVAETPDDWIRHLTDLTTNPQTRLEQARDGYSYVGKERMWAHHIAHLDGLYRTSLHRHKSLEAARTSYAGGS